MITLAELKAYLSITVSTYDTFLTNLISLAIGRLEGVAGRSLGLATYTNEVLEVEGSSFNAEDFVGLKINQPVVAVKLKNYPVATLTSVTLDGDALTSGEDFYLRADEGILLFYSDISSYGDKLLATYTAGYSDSTAPDGLKWILYEMCKIMFQNGATPTKGGREVESKRIGEYSVSYKSEDVGSFMNSAEVQEIVGKYKQIVV